jgi:hypothetical protein
MAGKDPDALAGGSVPEPGSLIFAGGGEQAPVGAESYPPHGGGVPRKCVDDLFGCGVPELGRPAVVAGGEQMFQSGVTSQMTCHQVSSTKTGRSIRFPETRLSLPILLLKCILFSRAVAGEGSNPKRY